MNLEKQLGIYAPNVNIAYKHSEIMGDFFSFSIAFFCIFKIYLFVFFVFNNVYYFIIGKI